MKRFLSLLVVVLMTISIIACSSGSDKPDASASPVSSASPKATLPTESPKTSASTAPTESPVASASTVPTETPKASATTVPSESPKASVTTAPTQTPKAAPTETPKASSSTPAVLPDNKPAPAPQAEEVSPKGKKVLYVGRDASTIPDEDKVAAERLKALGFSVTHMEGRDLLAEETKGYDLIYISQTINSKHLKNGVMKDIAIPTVYVKNHGMFYLGLSSQEEDTNVMNLKSISIVDSKHKVAGGLSGSVDVYKEAGDKIGIGYGIPGKEAKVIATIPDDKGKASIYYYDKGTKADNGYAVKSRISYFYLNSGLHENTTDNGWKLLDNLVLWTLQNG